MPHGGNDQDSKQGEQPNEDPLRHETRVLGHSERDLPGAEDHFIHRDKRELPSENKLAPGRFRERGQEQVVEAFLGEDLSP